MNLSGKRLLFVGIGFYDYDQIIRKEMERQGAKVSYICEPNRYNFLQKIVLRLGLAKDRLQKSHINKFNLELTKVTNADFLFVIKGEHVGTDTLALLRQKNPYARFILYQWDSIERTAISREQLKSYDRIFSFDPTDCAQYGFSFRPLFFRQTEAKSQQKFDYDLVFVGWLHFQRLAMVRSIFKRLEERGVKCYLYMFTSFFKWFKLYIKQDSQGVFFRKLSYEHYSALLNDANLVLDLPHPSQTGLTMRAIETLGSQKKLITTSVGIKEYPFYNEKNVFILLDTEIDIPDSFFYGEYQKIDPAIVKQYSLTHWINEIFQGED